MRPVWYAQQAWESVHVDDTGALLTQVFPERVFVRVPLLSERVKRMPPRQLPPFCTESLPQGWEVQEGAPLPWTLLPVSKCLAAIRGLSVSANFDFLCKIRFKDVDVTEYGRSPKEMLFLRSGVGVLVCFFFDTCFFIVWVGSIFGCPVEPRFHACI